MKKIIVILLMLSVSILNATIITVDNNPSPIGDYTNLLDAHDNAAADDTIYVLPSVTQYSAIDVTKKLSFYGVGYDLDENPGYQASLITSKIDGTIEFQTGSEYSKIEGFDGNFWIKIYTSNIIIKKNNISGALT